MKMQNFTGKAITTTAFVAMAFLSTVLTSTSVFADRGYKKHSRSEFYDSAKVIDVDPIVRHVRIYTPQQECWNEQTSKPIKHRVQHDDAGKNMIIGGLVGGIIGHHLGSGGGRNVATVAGSLIGASIAQDASAAYVHTGEYRIETRKVCQTVDHYRTENQTIGYNVTYRYKGEIFHTIMDQHPGKHIKVKVEIKPAHYYKGYK